MSSRLTKAEKKCNATTKYAYKNKITEVKIS